MLIDILLHVLEIYFSLVIVKLIQIHIVHGLSQHLPLQVGLVHGVEKEITARQQSKGHQGRGGAIRRGVSG